MRLSSYFRTNMARLDTSDLEGVMTFLADAQAVDGPAAFTTELLDELAALIGCEFVTYFRLDKTRSTLPVEWVGSSGENEARASDGGDDDDDEIDCITEGARAWFGHRRRVGFEGVAKLSDVLSRRLRTRLDWNCNYCEPWCMTDEMWVYLWPSWVQVASISVAGRRDFGERERTIAQLLVPHLRAMYRRATLRRKLDAALAALARDDGDGIVLVEGDEIAFASPAASRLLDHYFGATPRLPERIVRWNENGRAAPLTIRRDETELVVTALDAALLLREQRAGVAALTARERDVMRCVSAGLRNEEIAQKLWIAPNTVRKHLEHVYDKLGVRSRTAALAKLDGSLL
jgi:DNA-binding CsgD family transcriptional regulator